MVRSTGQLAAPQRSVALEQHDKGSSVASRPTQQLSPLFRGEVLDKRQSQWLGAVLLAPKATYDLFAGFAVFAIVSLFALLVFGSYTRTAHVGGWLMPQQGLAEVFATQSGVVSEVYVQEGQRVSKGAPLLLISGEVHDQTSASSRKQIVDSLIVRRDSLSEEGRTQSDLAARQQRDLEERLENIRFQKTQIDDELALQRRQVDIAAATLRRDQAMRARDLIPVSRLDQSNQAYLTEKAHVSDLARQREILRQEETQTEESLNEQPLLLKTKLGDIERQTKAVEQDLADAQVHLAYTVTAPGDGLVSNLEIRPGGAATANVPLLDIVPAGALLEAQLFCPSSAIGFVKPGQHVLLRYQAYPYQKFGTYDGVVQSVSDSAINPTELPPRLSGMTSLFQANQPLYRVTVSLSRQSAVAYGQEAQLEPGMQLDADIMLDHRSLLEWMFDPLLSLTGKWRG